MIKHNIGCLALGLGMLLALNSCTWRPEPTPGSVEMIIPDNHAQRHAHMEPGIVPPGNS